MSSIAVRMIFGSPAAADGDGCRFVEFQNVRRDMGNYVRAVAEWRVFRARAAAVSHALGYLFYDSRLNEVVVR